MQRSGNDDGDDDGATVYGGSSRPEPAASDEPTRFVPREERRVKVGDVIKERFELVELIGVGGMGAVFKAIDRSKQKFRDPRSEVALKLLSEEFRQHKDAELALAREARRLLDLSHANIVRAYDFDADSRLIFMTMEYLSGRSLDRIINDDDFHGLSLGQSLTYIRPAAAALAYAHENGIVHSDFKPSNVFVTDDGHVKILDFGIARVARPAGDATGAPTIFDAATLGAFTLLYAAPEQIVGAKADPRDDVFALACVTYELLTGRHPFDRMSAAKAQAEGFTPAPPAALGRRQWQGLKRALNFDRGQRTRTVEEFMREIAAGPPGLSKRWPLIAAGGAAAATVFGVVIWALLPGPDGPESSQRKEDPPPATTPLPRVAPPTTVVLLPPPTLEAVLGAIGGIGCALLEAEVDGANVTLTGHASDNAVAEAVARTKALPGVTDVRSNVLALDAYHCAPIDLASPPIANNRDFQLGLSVAPGQPVFHGGDQLEVAVTTPGTASYMYVDFYDSAGCVLHMLPRENDQDNYRGALTETRLGDGNHSGSWTIQAPFGRDLFVVTASPVRLYDGERPDSELASDYLWVLAQGLDQALATHARALAADFAIVTTEAQKSHQPAPPLTAGDQNDNPCQ